MPPPPNTPHNPLWPNFLHLSLFSIFARFLTWNLAENISSAKFVSPENRGYLNCSSRKPFARVSARSEERVVETIAKLKHPKPKQTLFLTEGCFEDTTIPTVGRSNRWPSKLRTHKCHKLRRRRWFRESREINFESEDSTQTLLHVNGACMVAAIVKKENRKRELFPKYLLNGFFIECNS